MGWDPFIGTETFLQDTRIELIPAAWEAAVLPLN